MKMVVVTREPPAPYDTAATDPRPHRRAARFCAGVRFFFCSLMHSGQM